MSFKEKILSHFALSEGEYFSLTKEVSYDDIPLLEGKEVDNFIFELSKLKEEKAKVLIYGDYDTDGVMATSVTYLALKEFGINAATYLPSRYNDGYGLNLHNLQKIYKQGFKAIILVDNGITLLKEVEEAKKLQYDVNSIIYKLCSGHGNMYAMIKEVLRINGSLDIGGVREPLTNLIPSDIPIAREAADMIKNAIEKYCR